MGINTLVKTDENPKEVTGGPKLPFFLEAWNTISRYMYTRLQGGSIMRGWMKRLPVVMMEYVLLSLKLKELMINYHTF